MKEIMKLLSPYGGQEKELFRTEDRYGPVVVLEWGNLRILSFDSPFEQSAMHLDQPLVLVHEYLRAMMLALAFKRPQRVTLLGLGGGSLLRALHARCPGITIQVVELRKSVISVATEYFKLPSDGRVDIHQCNGFVYLNKVRKRASDIIFADMYQAYAMEPFQSSTRFLEQCWQLLTNDGWLAINFHSLPDFNHPYMIKMCRLFPEVFCCGTGSGNFVVLCGKQVLKLPLDDYRDEVQRLELLFNARLLRYFDQIIKISTSRFGRLVVKNGLATRPDGAEQ